MLLLSDFESAEWSGGESTEGGGTGGDVGGAGDSVVVVVGIPDMMPVGVKQGSDVYYYIYIPWFRPNRVAADI